MPSLVRSTTSDLDCFASGLAVCRSSSTRGRRMTGSARRGFAGDLDAVVIATPVRLHYEMAKAALSVGKHVFIEKPMARTEAEAEELVTLAEREGLVLMVGHTFLFSPAVRRMKEIVDAGDIGEVQYISARRLNLGLFQKDINVAWDLAPHDISILLHLLDERPISVSCQGSS